MKMLSELLKGSNIKIDQDVEVAYLSEDNRDIKENTMYFALKGANFDGHNAIKQVVSDGASVIVYTDDIDTDDQAIYIKVDDINQVMAIVGHNYHDHPSKKMKMIGVTGTNGKTTVAWLSHWLLKQLDSSAYIGTIGVEYNDRLHTNHFTTPKAIELSGLLDTLQEEGINYVNMEVSSHALEQKRSGQIDFDYAIMTNFSPDHENFHGGIDNYRRAKQILFDDLKEEAYALLNIDDETYQQYKGATKAKVISYGIDKECDVRASNINLSTSGTTFDLKLFDKNYFVKTNLVAKFNVYNLMPVITILSLEGYDMDVILPMLENFEFPQGRMEAIDLGQDYDLIVDYAHTPDGFVKVLEYAKAIAKGRIVTVFGSAGGDRDHSKRPVLGQIASESSDLIILTQEDSRYEKTIDICNAIKAGIKNDVETMIIEKRKDAVAYAIEHAQKDDMILILGKANDKYNVIENDVDEDYEGDIDLSIRLVKEQLEKEGK